MKKHKDKSNSRFLINELEKEESWRLFRIIAEFVEGFDILPNYLPAVTVYGSARVKEDSPYYQMGRDLGAVLQANGYTVITGGGPGVMEAANRGAYENKGHTIGLNVDLPMEQESNPYLTHNLSFRYFFVRKVMLVKYSTAFILLPGGYGTLDELFETLTLIQTRKIAPFPVVLMGRDFWEGLVEWIKARLLAEGTISPHDLDLFHVTDDVNEAVELVNAYRKTDKDLSSPP